VNGFIALTLLSRDNDEVAISIQVEDEVDSLVLFTHTGYRADVVSNDEGTVTIYRDVRLTDEEVANSLDNMVAAMEAGVI